MLKTAMISPSLFVIILLVLLKFLYGENKVLRQPTKLFIFNCKEFLNDKNHSREGESI